MMLPEVVIRLIMPYFVQRNTKQVFRLMSNPA
jgi:hypothetical protein